MIWTNLISLHDSSKAGNVLWLYMLALSVTYPPPRIALIMSFTKFPNVLNLHDHSWLTKGKNHIESRGPALSPSKIFPVTVLRFLQALLWYHIYGREQCFPKLFPSHDPSLEIGPVLNVPMALLQCRERTGAFKHTWGGLGNLWQGWRHPQSPLQVSLEQRKIQFSSWNCTPQPFWTPQVCWKAPGGLGHCSSCGTVRTPTLVPAPAAIYHGPKVHVGLWELLG